MIYKNLNEKFEHEGKTFIIGEMVYATESAYYGLVGVIKEIRTDEDMETDNPSPEIICDFYAPVLYDDIKNLEYRLGSDYSLNGIIMAPSMILSTRNFGASNLYKETAYIVVEEWNYNGEGFLTEITVFTSKSIALMYFKVTLTKEAENGIIKSFKDGNTVVVDESEDNYEIYIDGDYCNNNYSIRILEKTLIE